MRIPVLQPPGRQDAIIPHVYRPRMAAAMEALSMAVYQETTLSFREAEGARFRIALINGCLMCQGYRIAADLQQALQAMDSAEAPNDAGRGEAPDDLAACQPRQQTRTLLGASRRHDALGKEIDAARERHGRECAPELLGDGAELDPLGNMSRPG